MDPSGWERVGRVGSPENHTMQEGTLGGLD
jgi:hypothetical protein